MADELEDISEGTMSAKRVNRQESTLVRLPRAALAYQQSLIDRRRRGWASPECIQRPCERMERVEKQTAIRAVNCRG
jgi:hypothetical protein